MGVSSEESVRLICGAVRTTILRICLKVDIKARFMVKYRGGMML
jgi:hypothetical protein